jgi:hypothetical protein
MEIDEQDLKWGLEFIVGTWKIDYIVNFWSDNLEHIPVAKFKSPDGKKYNGITFEFFEDHRLIMKDSVTKKSVESTWEQTGSTQFHYALNGFFDLSDGVDAENVETLEVFDGYLALPLGFISAGMKKTKKGKITKAPDIGDLEPSADDLKMNDIVGKYKIVKSLAMVGDNFDMYTREEALADANKRKAAGEIDDHELWESVLCMFDSVIEFTADHQVKIFTPIPPYASKKEIDEAVASGEITIVDGMIDSGDNYEWKAVNGTYYYDSREEAEIMGEKVSPWKKLEPDSDGLINFEPFVIKKI